MRLFIVAFFIVAVGATAMITSVWPGLWPSTASPEVIVGLAKVVDGDTIIVDDTRIRLEGIDAPEIGQKCKDSSGRDYLCGIVASKALRLLAVTDPVSCESVGKDRYGRELGICTSKGGLDINAELVRRGVAVAFRRYSMRYADIEDAARRSKAGLWSGTFEHPGCFRAARSSRTCKDELPSS